MKTLSGDLLSLIGEEEEVVADIDYKGMHITIIKDGGYFGALVDGDELKPFTQMSKEKAIAQAKEYIDGQNEEARPSQAADDKETAELARLTVEQVNQLKAIEALCKQARDKSNAYGKWLQQNKIEAHLSRGAESLADSIGEHCSAVMEVV